MKRHTTKKITFDRFAVASILIVLAPTLQGQESLGLQTTATNPTMSSEAFNVSSPQPWPGGIVAPWRTIGIDPDALRLASKALKASHRTLAEDVLATPSDLLGSMGQNPPIKSRQRALEFWVGPLKKPELTSSHVPPSALIEPVWCNLDRYHILFLTWAHSSTNQLLASTHHGIEKKQWDQMAKAKTLDSYLNQKLPQMLSQLTAIEQPPPSSPSAFQLALLQKRESTRRDEGSTWCLNLLFEESLARKTKVIRSLGADHLLALNRLLGHPPAPKRPTRYVTLDWNPRKQKKSIMPKGSNPAAWELTMETSEGVFAKTIPKRPLPFPFAPTSPTQSTSQTVTWSLGELKPLKNQESDPPPLASSGQLSAWTIEVPPPLLDFINQETQALKLADQPMVVKTWGAWAYLDRGRGWGLAMGDRLVADDGQVKGHVVRYFGPELELKSSRGFPVHEGAILYIRKGQRQVRAGTVFSFDPTSFPTPWPPPPPPQSNKR